MTPGSWEQEQNRLGEIARAVQVLRRGGVVGYPSETVWGLAALPASRAAVERLYTLKGREASKPVQLSCLDMHQARGWLRPGQDELERLAVFWPGPLTVLAWATATCPAWLAPGGVVGLRIPAHPLIQALLAAVGGTLATTSLNPSGLPAASSHEQAQGYGLADLLLCADSDDDDAASVTPGVSGVQVNPGPVSSAPFSAESINPAPGSSEPVSSGLASTVFDLRTRQVLRVGAVAHSELLAALA